MNEPILAGDRPPVPAELPGGAVPVTLLTGFLGAGKTTLLNHILNGDHGLRVGVLVNDFGAVNIDARLIEGVTENTISLANGCVCCQIRDDLLTSLVQLRTDSPDIDHVIIEASGIADPESVARTISDPRYAHLVRLDTITCVVDADTFLDEDVPPGVTELKLRQIGHSDLVVLNKVDLVGPNYAGAVRQSIAALAPGLSIVEAVRGDVPLAVLLAVDRFDAQTPWAERRPLPAGADEPGFDTFHYRSDTPLSLARIRHLVEGLSADVYRAKGIVLSADEPDRRVILQAVGRRVDISVGGPWDGDPGHTDIVVIGARNALDQVGLQRAFDACRAI